MKVVIWALVRHMPEGSPGHQNKPPGPRFELRTPPTKCNGGVLTTLP